MRVFSLSLVALAAVALGGACRPDACPDGQKKNLDGLCVVDAFAEGDADSDADADADTDADTDTDDGVSLYEQIGGQPAVSAVVGELLRNVASDPRINWMFANTDINALSMLLQDQICAATGGDCTYTGRSMVETHAGMAITDAQFDALVEDLLVALGTLGVPYSAELDGSETIDPLLVALVGMRADIVTDPAGDAVLFNQLGGNAGVSGLVSSLVANIADDSRINGRFGPGDLEALAPLLGAQLCAATGGYCVYSGKTMLEAHTGMDISDDEFTAMVEDFAASLDELGIDHTADFSGTLPADQLGQALAAMHDDIVGH